MAWVGPLGLQRQHAAVGAIFVSRYQSGMPDGDLLSDVLLFGMDLASTNLFRIRAGDYERHNTSDIVQ